MTALHAEAKRKILMHGALRSKKDGEGAVPSGKQAPSVCSDSQLNATVSARPQDHELMRGSRVLSVSVQAAVGRPEKI